MSEATKDFTEDELFDMSEEELEAAFNAAKGSSDVEDTTVVDGDGEDDLEQLQDGDVDSNEINDNENDVDDELDEDSEEVLDNENNQSDENEEQPESEEDKPTEEKDEDPLTKFKSQVFKAKANGKEFDFTVDEMIERFPQVFAQAMDYTKKMQAIKPWRKTIDALEQNNISQDQLNLAIDVIKGDKAAIAEVIKTHGLDTLDLDLEDSNYTPNDYGRDETTLALEDTIKQISVEPEFERTKAILGSEWDDKSWNEVTSNPEYIKLLHDDVKSGTYDRLAPLAEKIKLYDGGKRPDIEYYKEAARVDAEQFRSNSQANVEAQRLAEEKARLEAERQRLEAIKAEEQKRQATRNAAGKRKAAAPTNRRAGKGSVTDYLDADDDEGYFEWYNKLKNSQ